MYLAIRTRVYSTGIKADALLSCLYIHIYNTGFETRIQIKCTVRIDKEGLKSFYKDICQTNAYKFPKMRRQISSNTP